jgi:predicted nucleic acid-binding protein
MSGSFIDTNVFVYLLDDRDEGKSSVARELVRSALEGGDAAISFQVVQEALNVLTQKLPARVSTRDAELFLERFLVPLWKVMPSEALYRQALAIQERHRYGFYDALIIAAALAAGCTRLYSEDLHDGQRVERLTIVNPFRS